MSWHAPSCGRNGHAVGWPLIVSDGEERRRIVDADVVGMPGTVLWEDDGRGVNTCTPVWRGGVERRGGARVGSCLSTEQSSARRAIYVFEHLWPRVCARDVLRRPGTRVMPLAGTQQRLAALVARALTRQLGNCVIQLCETYDARVDGRSTNTTSTNYSKLQYVYSIQYKQTGHKKIMGKCHWNCAHIVIDVR